jgi:hypothetical protein
VTRSMTLSTSTSTKNSTRLIGHGTQEWNNL